VKKMLSAGPPWQGSALQTLRNARAEFNLQKLADKMFRRQGEVRERRRYASLYKLKFDTNWPRFRTQNLVSIMRPRTKSRLGNSITPGWEEMYALMYLPERNFNEMLGVGVYAPGWLRMRNVVWRTIFRLRVWIRRTLRRLVCTRTGQRFFMPKTFVARGVERLW